MKWNRAERWTDPSRLHSLLLAVFFFLGIGAGVVCAGRISGDVERELTTYLTDYLALAQSQDLGISVVCSLTLLYLQGPVLAFLCGVCSAGILLLPLLAAAAGFFPAYAAGCLTASFGGRGLLLALAGGMDRMALCSSINYLADSGYLQVRCIEDKAPSSVSDAELEDLEVKLTPRGIQLQRCVKKDPLVDM